MKPADSAEIALDRLSWLTKNPAPNGEQAISACESRDHDLPAAEFRLQGIDMRSLSFGSLRWIAGVCLLSGCYSPWMYPQQGYGYGNPYYSGQYMGGSQGIQTLTPGQYYAPGSTVPGTVVPNSLQPTPDDNSGGAGGIGGEAPLYNPGTNNPSSRPVPTYDGDDPGSGLGDPEADEPVKENNAGGYPGAMSEPVPTNDWAGGGTIETASMKADPSEIEDPEEATEAVEESDEPGTFDESAAGSEPLLSPEAMEESEEGEEESPPLLSVP